MKTIKQIGLIISLVGFIFFTGSIFTSKNYVSQEVFDGWIASKNIKSEFFIEKAQATIVAKELSTFELSNKIIELGKASDAHQLSQENIAWEKVMKLKWNKTSKEYVYPLVRVSAIGWVPENQLLFFWMTFGLAILGGVIL